MIGDHGLKIGVVARQASVAVDTIRYYERVGLVPAPPRRESGYRAYPRDTPRRVRFIKRAQELGFSLKEIKELLALRIEPGGTCATVRETARAKVRDVDDKLAELQRIRAGLVGLIDACPGDGPTSECPILDAFDTAEAGGDR